MRIVQVVSGLAWVGGVQEYVAGLSRGLTEQGHEVVLLAGGHPPPEGPRPHALADGLDIRFHPKRRLAKRYLYPTGLRASLREFRRWADIVHVHQPFFLGTWTAAATRLPLAATFHLHPEHLEGPSSQRRRRQLRLLLRRVDLVVGVSRAEVDLITTVRQPRRDGVVWPALANRPEPDSTRRLPLVAYVGRLSESKNLDTLLEAFGSLPAGIRRVVAGGGPDADRYRLMVADLGMDPDTVLRVSPTDEEISSLLTEVSVFVSVSQQEAFGIAALRAIAHGCRPVLSDIPSHREIVTTLGVGEAFLVDPHVRPQELSSVIESAVDAPPLSPEVSERVPTWSESAAVAADLYTRMLQDRRRKG